MPIMKAAKKAMRQSKKRQLRNASNERAVKEAVKEIQKLAKAKKKDEVSKKLNLAFSLIDKAAKRHIFHKNKAARKKSQLAKLAA